MTELVGKEEEFYKKQFIISKDNKRLSSETVRVNSLDKSKCRFSLTWNSKKMYILPSSTENSPAKRYNSAESTHSNGFRTVLGPKRTFDNVRYISEVLHKKIRSKTIEINFEKSNYELDTRLKSENFKKGFVGKKVPRSRKFVHSSTDRNSAFDECTLNPVKKKETTIDDNSHYQNRHSTATHKNVKQKWEKDTIQFSEEGDPGSLEGSRLLPNYPTSNQMINTYLGQARTKIKHKKQLGMKKTSRNGDQKLYKQNDPRCLDRNMENAQRTSMMVSSYKIHNKTERIHTLHLQTDCETKGRTEPFEKRTVIISYENPSQKNREDTNLKENVRKIRRKSFFTEETDNFLPS